MRRTSAYQLVYGLRPVPRLATYDSHLVEIGELSYDFEVGVSKMFGTIVEVSTDGVFDGRDNHPSWRGCVTWPVGSMIVWRQ